MSEIATARTPTIPESVRGSAFAVLAALLLCAPLLAQDQPPAGGDEPARQQEPEATPADAAAEGAEGGAVESEEPGATDDGAADGTTADEAADGTVAEDSDLDDQTYEGDDDVFVPSEEIPVDEPIPFPSDI